MDPTVSKGNDILRGMAVLGVIVGHILYTEIPVLNDHFYWNVLLTIR